LHTAASPTPWTRAGLKQDEYRSKWSIYILSEVGGRDDTGPNGCPALSTLPESQVNPLPIGTPARRVDARGHATERAGLTAAAKPMNGSFRLRICPRKTRVRIPKGIWPTDVFEPIRWLTRLPFEGIAMVPKAGLFSKTVDLNTNWLVPEIF